MVLCKRAKCRQWLQLHHRGLLQRGGTHLVPNHITLPKWTKLLVVHLPIFSSKGSLLHAEQEGHVDMDALSLELLGGLQTFPGGSNLD